MIGTRSSGKFEDFQSAATECMLRGFEYNRRSCQVGPHTIHSEFLIQSTSNPPVEVWRAQLLPPSFAIPDNQQDWDEEDDGH